MSARRRRASSTPTPRELEVFRLLQQPGAKRSSVAQALGISEHTVDAHLASLYRRLGVSSAAQAARRVELSI